jgi:hypothetical protein
MDQNPETITDLVKSLTIDEFVWVDRKTSLIAVISRKLLKENGEENIMRVFRILPGYHIEAVDIEAVLEDVVNKIEKLVDKRDFLRYILRTSYPPQLVEVAKRLQRPEIVGKVRMVHSCYALDIPGEDGEENIHLSLHG